MSNSPFPPNAEKPWAVYMHRSPAQWAGQARLLWCRVSRAGPEGSKEQPFFRKERLLGIQRNLRLSNIMCWRERPFLLWLLPPAILVDLPGRSRPVQKRRRKLGSTKWEPLAPQRARRDPTNPFLCELARKAFTETGTREVGGARPPNGPGGIRTPDLQLRRLPRYPGYATGPCLIISPQL